MILALVRHAKSVSNELKILSDDYDKYPLTEEGIRQAEEVANEIKKIGPEMIFSSPVLRARQTAEIIANRLGLKVIIDERLRERGLGELNGKSVLQDGDHWKLRLARSLEEVKGLESWDSLKARMLDFLDYVSKLDFTSVVAVSHYDPIRALVSAFFGLSDFQSWGISIPNASITLIGMKSSPKILGIGMPLLPEEVLEALKLEGYI